MTKQQAEKRITRLREQIDDYRYHYHVLNESTMSEAAADSLKHELSELEDQFPELITPDSPTQRVAGQPAKGFVAVPHSSPMLSLNDVFDRHEVEAWITRITKLAPPGSHIDYLVEIKKDGLAGALVYENGVLVQGITRGDGRVGEDVTTNMRTIESVPLRLRRDKSLPDELYTRRVEVRGEVLLYKADFEELNAQRSKAGLPLFANPRNTAAGTVRQLDARLVAERRLHFMAYILIVDSYEVPTLAQKQAMLSKLGFLVEPHSKVLKSSDEIMKFAQAWEEKRRELPFGTDGLVINVNDQRLFERLGVVGKAPRGAVAYKYPAEQSTTKVKDIFISIGRTGAATPVAMLEPVVVAGSTVQMATLHNESEVRRKDIRVGDTVIIQKAGDIIPEVVESLPKLRDGSEKPFKMPKACPECGTTLVKVKADEAVWRCVNNNCPSRVWKRIQHYASKAALDIEGMGEKNIIALLDAGLIRETPDIYKLKKEDLLGLERFADISATKLVAAIQARKNPPLARFLYGLGIRHVGVQTAVDLANHFHSLDRLAEATMEELESVEGVGGIVAESIVEWFSDPTNQHVLKLFAKYGVEPETVKKVGGPLAGQNFVVTGTLEAMSREEAAERIRSLGGTFQSSVGKDTDYLVVGANVGASKLTKATRLGTPQITEQALLKLLNK
jgi:DNA ligase (NAD+)